MKPLIFKEFKDLLHRGLEEDGYTLDWTSLGTRSSQGASLSAEVVAKADGIFFGESLALAAEAVSKEIGIPFRVKGLKKDGDRLKPGVKVLTLVGSAQGILALERPLLNLASYFGGMATRTHGLVSAVQAEWKKKKYKGEAPRVTSTRKILPHYRDSAIAAVIAGGGVPHRVNLSGGVLIKENHILAAGGISKAVRGVREVAPHGLKIEVEVRNEKELKEALGEKADIIMLDNFKPTEVKSALKVVEAAEYSPLIECSGGISENTIASYTLPGVHILSVGGLTHSVDALDLSLLCHR